MYRQSDRPKCPRMECETKHITERVWDFGGSMLAGRVSLAGDPDGFYLGKVDVILDCRHSLTVELQRTCRFSLAVNCFGAGSLSLSSINGVSEVDMKRRY